jgi:hypothetical protein
MKIYNIEAARISKDKVTLKEVYKTETNFLPSEINL